MTLRAERDRMGAMAISERELEPLWDYRPVGRVAEATANDAKRFTDGLFALGIRREHIEELFPDADTGQVSWTFSDFGDRFLVLGFDGFDWEWLTGMRAEPTAWVTGSGDDREATEAVIVWAGLKPATAEGFAKVKAAVDSLLDTKRGATGSVGAQEGVNE